MLSEQTAFHVALLAVAAYLTDRSSTAPTPPPKEDEIKPDLTVMERYLGQFARALAGTVKYMTWGAAGCTAAVLLAKEYPGELGTAILRRLLLDSAAAERIRLTPLALAGTLLTIVGAGIRVACFREMKRFFTFEVTVRDGHELCTRGPYSVVRHPSYTGWMVQSIGVVLWSCGAGSWAREAGWLDTAVGRAVATAFIGLQTYIAVGMFLRCSKEDELLRKEFGESWNTWASRVSYRLVPFIY